MDSREEEARGALVEELETHPLKKDDPTKTIQIRSALPEDTKKKLLEFLRTNSDIFAWTASEMQGIPTEVIIHRLNVNPECKPVWQKRRNFAPERQRVINEEVKKLLAAKFI